MNDILKFSIAGNGFDTACAPRLALGIGVFDGVHLGHRRIIGELVRQAKRNGAVPAAMTFDPHPRAVLHPTEAPTLLVPLSERIRLLREAGAELVLVVRFTAEFARLEPEEFLRRLLECPEFRLAGICVGERWRFGRGGCGDSALLREYARSRGLDFTACPELEIGGETVSSSVIRRAIAAGRLDTAAEMLGRPYRLTGVVEYGYGAATSRLSCPTANLDFKAGVLPPDGVYAGCAVRDGRLYPAAINVGLCPTFGWEQARRRVEIHLLDYTGTLYGSELGVEFLHHLREERTFTGPEELKLQIDRDLVRIREFFAQRQAQEGKQA